MGIYLNPGNDRFQLSLNSATLWHLLGGIPLLKQSARPTHC